MTDYIVLIDPALKDNSGTVSNNLGDCIISDSVTTILRNIFPNVEIIKISAHQNLRNYEKNILKKSLYSFVGGSNILTSQVRHFERLVPKKTKGFYFYPGFNKLILFGAGWQKYSNKPDWASIVFYQQILSKRNLHSLRDNYSIKQLGKAYVKNTLLTSCPTTWTIDTCFINSFKRDYDSILLTLTDYDKSYIYDQELIKSILDLAVSDIYFFSQGKNDLEYLYSLKIYKRNKSKFKVMHHSYQEFKDLLDNVKLNYIGTRLHAGISALNRRLPSLIIGIDNRALEMQKDIRLPVIRRGDCDVIFKWAKGEHSFESINLPSTNIERWKNQFIV